MSSVPMTLPGLMLAQHEQQFMHSTTWVELDDGRILLWCAQVHCHSDDGGLTWSQPQFTKDVNGDPVGLGKSFALVRLSGGGVGLAANRPSDDGVNEILFWRSEDGGQTWQPPAALPRPLPGTGALQDTILRTESGRIVIPLQMGLGQNIKPHEAFPYSTARLAGQRMSTSAHFFDPTWCACYVAYSDDDGRTWRYNEDGYLFVLKDWGVYAGYTVEPTIAEYDPGKLIMLMRTGLGRLYQSFSDDCAETWSRPEPTLLASSTAPAQVRRIPQTGHLLCVWNQHSEEEIRQGFIRTRLSSAISRNGGGEWEFFQNVESLHAQTRVEPGPIQPVHPEEMYFTKRGHLGPQRDPRYIVDLPAYGRFSYPSVLIWRDRVLISYTYRLWDAKARLVQERPHSSRMKVLPLKWFYGGMNPEQQDVVTPPPAVEADVQA